MLSGDPSSYMYKYIYIYIYMNAIPPRFRKQHHGRDNQIRAYKHAEQKHLLHWSRCLEWMYFPSTVHYAPLLQQGYHFFDLEKAYETTLQYGIIRDLHRIGLKGRLPVFVSEYLRDRRIRVRIGTTLSDEFYPEEGVPLAVSWLWHVLDWRLRSCPLVLPRTSSKHSLSMTWRSVFEDALWTP